MNLGLALALEGSSSTYASAEKWACSYLDCFEIAVGMSYRRFDSESRMKVAVIHLRTSLVAGAAASVAVLLLNWIAVTVLHAGWPWTR